MNVMTMIFYYKVAIKKKKCNTCDNTIIIPIKNIIISDYRR